MFDRVVLFDVGRTLVGPVRSFGDIYSEVLRGRGHDVDSRRCQEGLKRAIDTMDRMIPTGQDRYAFFPGGEAEYWQQVATIAVEYALDRKIETSEAIQILEQLRDTFLERKAWHVYPDVVPTLEALQTAGVGLCVVSNWDSRLRQVLELTELLSYFHEIVASADVGAEKPDAKIFRLALQRLKVDASQAVHVGDRVDLDVRGAEAAGVRGIWLDRGRDRHQGRDFTGVERIKTLSELLAIVREPA